MSLLQVGDLVTEYIDDINDDRYGKTLEHKVEACFVQDFPNKKGVKKVLINGCVYDEDEIRQFKKWEPKEGEWCVFYNEENAERFVVAKFDHSDDDQLFRFRTKDGDGFKYCKPYVGGPPCFAE